MENTTSLHRQAGRMPLATTHAGAPGDMHEISTDGVAPHERFAFMQRMNLDRLSMSRPDDAQGGFDLRMRRFFGRDAHLIETRGAAVRVERTREHALRDGVDYVSFNVVAQGRRFVVEHNGHVHRLRAGMAFLVDSTEPLVMDTQRHVLLSLFVPRYRVMDAVGRVPDRMPAALAGGQGLGAVVAAQLQALVQEAGHMTASQRIAMVGISVDLALDSLRAALGAQTQDAQAFENFYLGACRLIRERCGDPQLEPGALAAALGCSRATLYRAFAAHGEGVAQRIWDTRLTLARNMIESSRHVRLTLGDIALECGFLDQSAFNRMFRRRHGMTPGEARSRVAAQAAPGSP